MSEFPCQCGCVVYVASIDEFICDECGMEWSPLEAAIWDIEQGEE